MHPLNDFIHLHDKGFLANQLQRRKIKRHSQYINHYLFLVEGQVSAIGALSLLTALAEVT